MTLDDSTLMPEPEEEQPQVTQMTQASASSIRADLVRMHQSAAQTVVSSDAGLHQSAALEVKTENAAAHESALGLVNAVAVNMENSGAGALLAETVQMNGYAGAVIAENAEVGTAYVGVVAGREVRAQRIESVVMLARHVEGDVQVMLDARGALIAGLLGGALAGSILLIGRLLFGRKS